MPISLSSLALCKNPTWLRRRSSVLVARDNRIVSQAELEAAQQTGDINPVTLLPLGFQPVFLRGQAQTNSVVRLSQSLFAKLAITDRVWVWKCGFRSPSSMYRFV